MRASVIEQSGAARRAFVAHCSLLLAGAALALAPPVHAQGPSRSLLVVGDSLSAEYGLPRGSGWVALLEQRLAREALAWKVTNASISGDTTAGGRSRLPPLLAQLKPQLVLIELGGNDALRGLPLASTQANLQAMTRAAKAIGARVMIAGIAVPPNYGRAYNEALTALYVEVARVEGVALLPMLLAGVADAPNADELFQPDRIHPKAEAHPRILANVWPVLRPLLK